MIGKYLFLIITAMLLLSPPLQAAEISAEKEYARCIKLAKSKPQAGYDAAIAWTARGGELEPECDPSQVLGRAVVGQVGSS